MMMSFVIQMFFSFMKSNLQLFMFVTVLSSILFFETEIFAEPGVILVCQQTPEILSSTSLLLGLQVHASESCFYVGVRDLNSGPQTY